jgi:3-oxoacyl-[acyl-carrier-protein] synthase-3
VTGSKVLSLGHYQPSRVVTNDELAQMVDTNDAWIRDRVGIAERRIAAPDETVADMASAAAEKALAGSGLDADDIDLVIVATCSSMDRCPNVATRVAANLGIAAPGAMDLNTACSGFS